MRVRPLRPECSACPGEPSGSSMVRSGHNGGEVSRSRHLRPLGHARQNIAVKTRFSGCASVLERQCDAGSGAPPAASRRRPRSGRPKYRAAASSGTSTTANPPRCSLVSTYGPSVNKGVPPLASTLQTAVDASRPPSLKTKTPAVVISSIKARAEVPLSRNSSKVRSGTHFVVEEDQVQGHLKLLWSRAAQTTAAHLLHERTRVDPTPRPRLLPSFPHRSRSNRKRPSRAGRFLAVA